MTNSCDILVSNLQDLIELKHISILKFSICGFPSIEFESKEWVFEGQFIKTELAHFDMNLLASYKIESTVLSLFFEH